MANNILNDLNFEEKIKKLDDRPLLEFIARQTYEITGKCRSYDKDITLLKNGDRKVSSILGGISGTITAIIIGIIGWFIRN